MKSEETDDAWCVVRERRITKDTKITKNGSELSTTYTIEDVSHAEPMSEHESLRDAIAELERLAQISWNEEPNRAPCTSWRTCGREYEIVECDMSVEPPRVRRIPALEISRGGVRWAKELLA